MGWVGGGVGGGGGDEWVGGWVGGWGVQMPVIEANPGLAMLNLAGNELAAPPPAAGGPADGAGPADAADGDCRAALRALVPSTCLALI